MGMSDYPYRDPEDGWLHIDPKAGESAEGVVRAFERWNNATSETARASTLVDLSNHLFDLSTWVPPEEYDE
jgi:hypothetical protein